MLRAGSGAPGPRFAPCSRFVTTRIERSCSPSPPGTTTTRSMKRRRASSARRSRTSATFLPLSRPSASNTPGSPGLSSWSPTPTPGPRSDGSSARRWTRPRSPAACCCKPTGTAPPAGRPAASGARAAGRASALGAAPRRGRTGTTAASHLATSSSRSWSARVTTVSERSRARPRFAISWPAGTASPATHPSRWLAVCGAGLTTSRTRMPRAAPRSSRSRHGSATRSNSKGT